MPKQKILLAYSGGLDTSVIIPWLKENYDCDVICCAAEVGQGEELSGLREKALASGASKLYIEDLREEFITDFIFPTLQMGAIYEKKYLLGTSFARPVIAKRLVEIAKKENCDAISHGCTGKGNDQVRFELAIKAFAPELTIIAPWRLWNIKSREEAVEYLEARGLPAPVAKSRPYSMDRNLWHLSHEGADLEFSENAPPDDLCLICSPPELAPDEAEHLSITFEKGIPVAVNGGLLSPVALMEAVNRIAAKHGVGIADMVENRLVGMKSRGVYETPGGTVLYAAHQMLEQITLDRDTSHYKEQLAIRFAELVYDGLWFSPLREALSAFAMSTQKNVSGVAKVKLYKGNIIPQGVSSPFSLYSERIATFGDSFELYSHKDSEGFINLFGLPTKIQALMKEGKL